MASKAGRRQTGGYWVGYWVKNLARIFASLGSLAAVCESAAGRLNLLKQQYPALKLLHDFADVLNDQTIDAVAISTPAESHAEMVREALVAGKDVFVEKPLCLSVQEGAELVGLAQEHNRILMVGHLLWYHPAVLKLKELFRTGELGLIQYVYSNRVNLGKIRREENILWAFAPHDISVILGLLDEMPDVVIAQGGTISTNRSQILQLEPISK